MPKDVRTISDTIFFRDNTTGIASISLVDKDLIISNLTTGMIQIGDAASDVYIGNGTDSVDIIFEQNGEIRGLTGKTLTLGQSDSFITFASDTTFNRNTYFNSGLFINRLAVGTGTGSPLAIVDIYDNFDNSIPSLRIFNPGSNFDPYIRFVPSSTGNSFSIGIDDSDNDLFKISSSTGLGLSDRLVITTGGFIGINTTSPESLLHVRGGSGPAWTPSNKPTVYICNDGTVNSFYVFGIKTSAADAFTVTNAANVGVRTTSPNYQFDVLGTGNFSAGVRYPDGLTQTIAYTGLNGIATSGFVQQVSGAIDTRLVSTGNNLQTQINNVSGLTRGPVSGIAFFGANGALTGVNNRFIYDSGNVRFAIGTGVVGAVVDIVDTGANTIPTLRLTNLASNFDPYIRFTPALTGNSYAIGIDDSDEDKFKISYGADLGIGDRLIITTGGFVGINTGSPGFNLHVNGTGAFNTIRFNDGTVQTTAFTGIGGSVSITGPANTISFFSGNGALTGSSSLTYDPIRTSFTLTTQGNTPSTGFVILNDQNQSGNVFQIRSYISDVNATTYNNQYIANTGDGSYTSNAGFNATNNLIDLIQGTGTFCTGFFPFSITGYVAGKTVIEDGANLTLTNNQVFATGLIEGEIAIYTGDANPQNPSNTGTLATQITKLSSAIPFSVEGSGSNSITDLDLSPLLGQYFALHPTNTGNVLFYYTVYPTTGGVSQNAIASASNPSTGLRPRLDVSFTVYEYAGTSTNKPIYSVDHVGRVKVGNIDRSDQLINSFLFYASGEPNQNANIQVESPNNGARVVFSQNNNLLYSMGTLPDRRFIIRSELFNTLPIMIFPQAENNFNLVLRSGYVGIKTNTPQYTLHVNGDGYMKSLRFFRYTNASQVPNTSRTLYSIGNNLFWNGSQLALGGDSSYTWTVRDGSNNSETVGDGTTVFWSGAGTVSTSYATATNIMTITGSPGWNLGVGNAATVAVATNNNVTFTGLGNITVSRNGTQISISGSSTPVTGSNYNWNLGVGNESTTTIASGNTVTFTGINGIRTTRSTNQITLTGPHSVVNSGNVTTNAVVNLTSGTLQTFTLTGNTTFTVTGVTSGARFMLRLEQGSVGNYTATFNFPSGNIKWPGGSAPTISTGVGNATLVGFVHTSGTFFYDGFVIATGIR